ncbi:MAG: hypothetical protein GEU99_20855 [Luteitalea sp.]|nr:hypothetical protein [Luteitalea sp.]
MSSERISVLKSAVRLLFAVAVSAVVLAVVVTAHAQTFLGSIVGLVTDTSDAVVAGAQVTLTEVQTGIERTATTSTEGNYVFADIRPGVYTVAVSSAGLKQVISSKITLTTQQTARFDAQLEAGDIEESVEVAALAPTLNTENAQLGDIRTREDLLTLPVNSRNPLQLRGVTSSNYEPNKVGGQRGLFGFYSIDGVSGMAPAWGGISGPIMQMPVEALQEVKHVASNPSAEYGDVSTLYLSTRSGTNQPRGSLFYLHSNNAFNARRFFTGEKPTGPILHEIGGSLGGPVMIPNLYSGRNRTFFYFTYERREVPGNRATTASVPTEKMRQGDFSELLPDRQIIDPSTEAPFPGNIIPPDRLSPVALNIQDPEFMPLPNFGSPDLLSNNYRDVRPIDNYDNLYSIRGDHTLSAKDSLSLRFTKRHNEEPRYDSPLPAFFHFQHRDAYNAYVSHSRILSSTVVNEFRVGFSRDASPLRGIHNGAELVERWGLEGLNLSSKTDLSGVPNVSWSSFPAYTEFGTSSWAHSTYELLNNVTFTKGRHLIKTGFLMRRYHANVSSGTSASQRDFGTYSFTGEFTGFDYADFLLGLPFETTRLEREPDRTGRYGYLAGYVQDDWHVTPKLTVNFGLRYEYEVPPTDKHDMRYTFDPQTGALVVPTQEVLDTLVNPLFPSSIDIITAAEAGLPTRSLMYGDKTNWGPRVGLAYRPVERTVVRGGYGIYYTPLTHTVLDPMYGGPFQSEEVFRNSITDGVARFGFPDPFTDDEDAVPTQSIGWLSERPRAPYTHQWNLTVERELAHAIVARVTWRGHRVARLFTVRDINRPAPSTDPANERRQYPQFFAVDRIENGGSELGNLLEVEVQRKFSQGLSFQAGWTWAKVLSDIPGETVHGRMENPYDLQRERADNPTIPRHRAVFAGIYELPFGTGKRFGQSLPGWAQQALGNWQISTILIMRSGLFATPSYPSGDFSNTRASGGRPDIVGDWRVSNPTIDGWFDPSAFEEPAAGTFGNSARSVIVGPRLVNLNLGVFKFFRAGESLRLRLDMTATNVLNHPNFGLPVSNLNSVNAGRITGLAGDGLGADGREIKLGLRLDF